MLIKLFAMILMSTGLLFAQGTVDKVKLLYGDDTNVKLDFKGRAGNLDLRAAESADDARAVLDLQEKGSGYVSYDRDKQLLKWETRIPYTFNKLSSNIEKVAPQLNVALPAGAELDVNCRVKNLGYGNLDFGNLNIVDFRLKVRYGHVDVDFSTENKSIMRDEARFSMFGGDLAIENLANLKAENVRINGGFGELSVDFGPKLLQNMNARLDLDIGNSSLTFPSGTHVIITGTSRDLAEYGFVEKEEGTWVPQSFSPNSPKLNIRIKGPLGDMVIVWE
jgi:hypothetical protein